jgi:hypothetical protein
MCGKVRILLPRNQLETKMRRATIEGTFRIENQHREDQEQENDATSRGCDYDWAYIDADPCDACSAKKAEPCANREGDLSQQLLPL